MKVLMIWDQLDVGIRCYAMTGELADLALKANGQYINNSDVPEGSAVQKIRDLLYDSDGKKKKAPRDMKIVSRGKVGTFAFDAIVVCGILP